MTIRLLFALFAALLGAGQARAEPWPGFPIIEWQTRTPQQLAALKQIGVTAAAVIPNRDPSVREAPPQAAALQAAGLRCYFENIATDFYSAYHRWTPGKVVNWRYLDLQPRYRADPSDMSLLLRDPSLSDPVWQAQVRMRLIDVVRWQSACRPLFYDLGDEAGIADLSAFWDFDLSPSSMAGMRAWLRHLYGSLAALNAEWGTQFPGWDAVQPELTRSAMRREDGNYAAWSDFKAWMDVAFARALRAGTDAVHAADPLARAGMEGVQRPGWGGYDLSLLAGSVDVMEVSSTRDSLPMLHALNPRLVLLATTFGAEPQELHAIWRAVLNGARGLILWDDTQSIVGPEGSLGARGETYAPLFADLHKMAPLLGRAETQRDPVAVLYSPESFRVQWMLDRRPQGDAWIMRRSEHEVEDNAWRLSLRGYLRTLAELHVRPQIVTQPMLHTLRARVLILPDTLSLSPEAARDVARFAAQGRVVIADIVPGAYDGHGRRMPRPILPPDVARMVAPDDSAALGGLLSGVGVTARVPVRHPDGSNANDVEAYLYRSAVGSILALQCRQYDRCGREVVLQVPQRTDVRDLRTGQSLGTTGRVALTLDPIMPALLELRGN